MRVAAQVTLTASERRRLETWASARSTAVRLVERSKIILMACAGMTNQAIAHALGIDQNTEVLRFLKKVDKTVPKEQELHIILDNYATHKHEEVLRWIEGRKRIFLHFIPRVHPG